MNAYGDSNKTFSHRTSPSFPSMEFQSWSAEDDREEANNMTETFTYEPTDAHDVWSCYQSILIRIGRNKTKACLCPPNYYGDRCQYQSPRVSLTLRFRKDPYHKLDIISVIITLADQTGFIHSYEQVTYIPAIDCTTKYNLHLLYQTRPKDITKNYTIHIDVYDRWTLSYMTSWTLAVPFLFLPVNRISAQLRIPDRADCQLLCSQAHAEPLKEVDLDRCRCYGNRSATISTMWNQCDCASDSICLCRLNATGPRCYLKSVCQDQPCKNGGICVPYHVRASPKDFLCVCPSGYSGDRCESKDVTIDISFAEIEIPESLLLHYITVDAVEVIQGPKLPRTTMLTKVPYYQNTIRVQMALPFHLLFAQLFDSFYLLLLQHDYTPSSGESLPYFLSKRFESSLLSRSRSVHVLVHCRTTCELFSFRF